MSLEHQTNGASSMPPPSQAAHATAPRSRRSSFHPHPPLSPSAATTDQNLPTRHPRPLTPAELHNELEKEQEAMVNRLTRELSALRAHSASVASTASTSSNAPFVVESTDRNSFAHPLPLATGPTHPSGARHRSSSTASSSMPLAAGARSASNSVSAGAGPALLSTSRLDEVSQQRQELEAAKRENERLKSRIIELEAQVRLRAQNGTSSSAS